MFNKITLGIFSLLFLASPMLVGAAPASCLSLSFSGGVGATGSQVSSLQTFLGISPSTGYFGAKTKIALAAWQSAHGVLATGFFGPLTRAAMSCNAAQSDFSAKPSSGSAPLTVTFHYALPDTTAYPSGEFYNSLDFGDGNKIGYYANGENLQSNCSGGICSASVTHTYATAGTFTASLYHIGSSMSDALCKGASNADKTACNSILKKITVTTTNANGTSPSVSVSVSPSAVMQGGNLIISWSAANAPVGAAMKLELIGSSGTHWDQLTDGNKPGDYYGYIVESEPLSGTYTWTVPGPRCSDGTDSCPRPVEGPANAAYTFPGSYTVIANLYMPQASGGPSCAGCDPSHGTSIAEGQSSAFTITKTK